MSSTVVRNVLDSYVAQSQPTKNFGTVALMYTGTGYLSYLHWGNPVPLGAKVVSANLHVFSAGPWAGSITLTAQAVGAAWSANRVTWNNDPGVVGATATQVKSNAGKGTHWIINITALMQAVANGQKWYGLRLSASGAVAKPLHSTQGTAQYRPYIELVWSDAPLPPTNLSPRGGGVIGTAKPILTYSFHDVSGNRSLAGHQVQISTVSNFASTVYDSGQVAATIPSFDLGPTAFTASSGVTYYWRVRTQDGAGLWSDYSTAQTFVYLAPPTVTLTSPSIASPFVEEPSPPVAWTFSGTQTAYRVTVADPAAPSRLAYDSGMISSTNAYHTIPTGIIKTNGYTYTITVQVRDNQARVAVPGFPPYAEASLDFDYRYTAAVSPMTSIAASVDALGIFAEIEAHRATVPDFFTLTRNGRVLQTNIPGVSVQDGVDPTLFTFTDMPPGRQTVQYTVIPIVNGRSAASNPTANLAVRRTYSWVTAPDGTLPVAFANPSHETSDSELSAVLSSVAGPPMLVTQALQMESGSFSGTLSDAQYISGLTARQMRDNLRAIRRTHGGHARLLFADEAMEVYLYNLEIQRAAYADGSTDYLVQFDFFQVS